MIAKYSNKSMARYLLIILILCGITFSQNVMNPISFGTAGAAVTLVRGDDAIGWNPANLGFEDNPEFSMSFGIIPIVPFPAINIVNDAISANWIVNYLLDWDVANSEKNSRMLDDFDEEVWNLSPQMYAKILGISSDKFAFSIGSEVNSDLTIPISALEFFLLEGKYGEDISINEIDGSAQLVIPFSLSFGFPLEVLNRNTGSVKNYLGLGVKFLWGIANWDIESFEGNLVNNLTNVQGSGTGLLKYSNDGFGVALDAGWAIKITDKILSNIAIQNLFGFITWNDKNTTFREFNFDAYINTDDNFNTLIADAFVGDDSTYSAKGFTSKYPTFIIAGLQYDVSPKMELFVNYQKYLSDEFQYSTNPRFSFATKMSPAQWIPIRLGIAVGGFEKFQTGVGFGLHAKHYHFDFGITQTAGLFSSAHGLGISIGQKILF